MATVIPGSVVLDIRGSIGTVTYGRNQGGIFVRNRTSPAQPASADRDATQAAMTALSQAWSGTLTQTQRDTWQGYGLRHPMPDRWGRPKTIAGICHFIRSNTQRYRDETAITATSAPLLPPPPMPAFGFAAFTAYRYNATGTPAPDCTGAYDRTTDTNGANAYRRSDGAYFVWWDPGANRWWISSALGSLGGPQWSRLAPIAGVYTPSGGGATGNVTMTLDATVGGFHLEPPDNFPDPPTNLRLFAYAGEQVTVGRNFYGSPWRYIGRNTFDGADWTSDPWSLAHWAALTVPGRVFIRLVAVLADGATSVRGHAQADIQT